MLRFPTTLLSATATAVASFRFSTKCDGKIDRTKILVEPDVFGVFLTYKVAPSSNTHLGLPATLFDKAYAKEELKEVMKHHENSVICDAYITRGVSADSDLLLRIHSKDVVAAQRFAIDFQKSKLGRRLIVIESLTGVTKTLNYITKPASSSLNDSLFKTPYSNGPPVFGIVVPIKKVSPHFLVSLLSYKYSLCSSSLDIPRSHSHILLSHTVSRVMSCSFMHPECTMVEFTCRQTISTD